MLNSFGHVDLTTSQRPLRPHFQPGSLTCARTSLSACVSWYSAGRVTLLIRAAVFRTSFACAVLFLIHNQGSDSGMILWRSKVG